MISVANIRALDAQLNDQIEAANTAALSCTALAPSDATAWSGFYAAWVAIHQQWTATSATLLGGINVGGVLVVEYYAQDLYNTMLTYQTALPGWQTKIHAACPSYTIPPSVLTQPPPSDRWGQFTDQAIRTAEVVGGIAATALVAVIAFKTYKFIKA